MKTLLTLLTSAALVNASSAATISWTFSEIVNTPNPGLQNLTGTGFLDDTGTFIYAENTGGAAASLDGISFIAGTIDLGLANYVLFHANPTDNPITSSAAYGPTTTITLGTGGVGGALATGATYRVQAIVMDGRGTYVSRTYEIDGMATDHSLGVDGSTYGNALLATGMFVADASSQSFSGEVFTGVDSDGGQLNGLVLHQIAIPEPSAFTLFGLSGLSLFLRRRRK